MKTSLFFTGLFFAFSFHSFSQSELSLLEVEYVLGERSERAASELLPNKAAEFNKISAYKSVGEYVSSNLVYPESCARTGRSGIVKAQFTITVGGKIRELEILDSPDHEFSKEVRRLFIAMPNGWSPASKNGVAVSSRQQLNVNFRLR